MDSNKRQDGSQYGDRLLRFGIVVALMIALYVAARGTAQTSHAATVMPLQTVNTIPFFANYLKPEFLLPVLGATPGTTWGGDQDALYTQLYFPVSDQFELLMLGEFPQARYFSITVYDGHGAQVMSIQDEDIVPLVPGQQNPYVAGGPEWSEDILYAVSIGLGGGPITPTLDCDTTLDVQQNRLDASLRHSYYTLNPPPNSWAYSDYHMNFSVAHPDPDIGTIVHEDEEANTGGLVMLRTFLKADAPNGGQYNLTRPLMWLRRVSTGCAVQLAAPGRSIPATCAEGASPPLGCWYRHDDVMNRYQEAAHHLREKELAWLSPYGTAPNSVQWLRAGQYILDSNPDTSYVIANIPPSLRPESLNTEGTVMRLRVRLPEMPAIPCDGPDCILTGDELLRYWSLTFIGLPQIALHTLSDLDLVLDADGYATILVSFGTPIDPAFNADTGYTVVNLVDEFGAPLPVVYMVMRTMLPGDNYVCSGREIPFHNNEHNEAGGFMERLAPLVDQRYPVVGGLPAQATTFSHPEIDCVLP